RTVSVNSLSFQRGYTGHEHLDSFGLVNMNGRMYDPALGRFLSPDPYVQLPDFSQNFNRYSYCLNNPLMYTDPSGEFITLPLLASSIWMASTGNIVANSLHSGGFWQSLGYGLIGAVSGAAGFFAGSAVASVVGQTGFVSAAIGGFTGGFTGAFTSTFMNSLAHGNNLWSGLSGGLFSGLKGGAFSGLFSGVLGGLDAVCHDGNFFTGKGATYIYESVTSGDMVGGDYFTSDEMMQEYLQNEKGWNSEDYGIDISVEDYYDSSKSKYIYYRDGGVIHRTQKNIPSVPVKVAGYTVARVDGSLKIPHIEIYMSPHKTLNGFIDTLNHELFHAYHHQLNLSSQFSNYGSFRMATEYAAYRYQYLHAIESVIRSNAIIGMNRNFHMNSFLTPILPCPPYLIR
ncbi:MAG: RHS repeat-associated core domain-containing protein, partial [Bacteroides sp.]|nr:RHS repeat-associated core domain-containing protein [Bacteroides sp.]